MTFSQRPPGAHLWLNNLGLFLIATGRIYTVVNGETSQEEHVRKELKDVGLLGGFGESSGLDVRK